MDPPRVNLIKRGTSSRRRIAIHADDAKMQERRRRGPRNEHDRWKSFDD